MQADEINKNRSSMAKPKEESRMLRRKTAPQAASAEDQAVEKQAEQLVSEVIDAAINKAPLKKKPVPTKVSFKNVHPIVHTNLMG